MGKVILALDLATTTGIAVGDSGERPDCSHVRLGLRGSPHGHRFMMARKMILRLLDLHSPDIVALEQPLASDGGGHRERAEVLFGLRGIVCEVCYGNRTDLLEASVSTIRSHFLGRSRGKRSELKDAVMMQCRIMGYDVKTHDEADAAALWDWACSISSSKHPGAKV